MCKQCSFLANSLNNCVNSVFPTVNIIKSDSTCFSQQHFIYFFEKKTSPRKFSATEGKLQASICTDKSLQLQPPRTTWSFKISSWQEHTVHSDGYTRSNFTLAHSPRSNSYLRAVYSKHADVLATTQQLFSPPLRTLMKTSPRAVQRWCEAWHIVPCCELQPDIRLPQHLPHSKTLTAPAEVSQQARRCGFLCCQKGTAIGKESSAQQQGLGVMQSSWLQGNWALLMLDEPFIPFRSEQTQNEVVTCWRRSPKGCRRGIRMGWGSGGLHEAHSVMSLQWAANQPCPADGEHCRLSGRIHSAFRAFHCFSGFLCEWQDHANPTSS